MIFFQLKIAFLILILIICLTFFAFSLANGLLAAPFVPSSRKKSRKMIEAAELKPTDTVYDLGSGDGRLVIMAGRAGVLDAVGFELNPFLNVFARIKARFYKLKNTTFLTKSMWSADLSECDKLFVYLLPKSMRELETKVLADMKNGSLVISNSFSFKTIEPIEVIDGGVRVYRIEK